MVASAAPVRVSPNISRKYKKPGNGCEPGDGPPHSGCKTHNPSRILSAPNINVEARPNLIETDPINGFKAAADAVRKLPKVGTGHSFVDGCRLFGSFQQTAVLPTENPTFDATALRPPRPSVASGSSLSPLAVQQTRWIGRPASSLMQRSSDG